MKTERYKILVVDDEEPSRRLCKMILEEEDFDIDLAGNGLEAWKKIENEEFDLLLVDRMMPVMTGDELINKIRQSGNNIPAIILSALGSQDAREEGIELGANQYIAKANKNFSRELVAWSKNLVKEYRHNQQRRQKDEEAKRQLLRNLGKTGKQLKQIEMSKYNSDKFISFEIAGANWEGDYKLLSNKLVESIETLNFPNWERLSAALLLKVNGHTVRIKVEENSEDEKILEAGFNKFFVEVDANGGIKPVRVVWSVPWETQEDDEGLALLIYNLPPDLSSDDFDDFGLQDESDREIVQGATYRFLEYMARVIGNFEMQRKFKDLVSSASKHLDKAIQDMDAKRQRQMEIFETVFSDLSESENLNLSDKDQKALEDILNMRFDSFQELEMHGLNDIQHLLKWVRKLKSQFKESENEEVGDEADAEQIGGSQADVENLLAQFDM